MLKSSFCDYSDVQILFEGTITAPNTVVPKNGDKKVITFKNCAPFTDCISEINNAQRSIAKYIDVVMPMYNLIKYSNNDLETSASL